MLGARLGPTGEDDSFIPRAIVHRLDRGTTGLLVVAKTAEAEAYLAAQFRGHSMAKRYVAILAGQLAASGPGRASLERSGTLLVDEPIAFDPARPGKVVVGREHR
eukprot:7069459-Prymnesium_polylepis.1